MMQPPMMQMMAWASFLPRSARSSYSFNTLDPLQQPRLISPRNSGPSDRVSAKASADSAKEKSNSDGDELSASERYRQALRKITEAETALSNPTGSKMSHEILRFDEDGIGPRDRYVYVEETDCIGCTHCATTAPGTFFLEDGYGRARVYSQTGDIEPVVEEAIDTCPVNCIYYVDWDDLVKLELMRKDQVINNWTRLVGGQDVSSSRKGRTKTKVMDSGLMRCEDCPGRGCSECPLFGVGQNPEFLRKKAQREAKKSHRQEDERKRRRKKV